MAEQTKLGVLIDEQAKRDAIHIAIAPVRAVDTLGPGAYVALAAGTTDEVVRVDRDRAIGIVDPFLRKQVRPGERFYLFLLPQTITSLRHEWTHPAFDAGAGGTSPQEEARQWIEAFAAELDQTYDRLLDAAHRWLDYEDYTYDNSETYKGVDYAKWPIFWKHFETVTGREVKDHGATFFTCSC